MKKLLYIVVLTICFMLALIGKSYGRDIKIEWQKCYGGTSFEFGNSIVQTFDGGYVFVGTAFSNNGDVQGNSGANAWVVKLDRDGIIQWKKILDNNQSSDDDQLILQTKDSSYLIAENYSSSVGTLYFDIRLTKLNKQGSIIWSKIYRFNSSQEIFVTTLIERDNGEILLSAQETYGYFSVLMKLNNTGGIIWQKNFDNKKVLTKIIKNTSDGYALLFNNKVDTINISVMQINNAGDSLSEIKMRSSAFGLTGYDINITKDKEYIIVGGAYNSSSPLNNGFVAKIDSNGSIKWFNKLINLTGNALVPPIMANIIATKKTNEFVIGYNGYSYFTNSGDIFVSKVDLQGNILNIDSLGGSKDERFCKIIESRDGSFIIIGSVASNDGDITCIKGLTSATVVKIFFNPNYITGNIFIDNNNNCVQNNNEKGLPNYSIKASNDLYTSYSTSGINGKYYLTVSDTGLYNLELLPNYSYPYYSTSNCNSYAVHLRDSVSAANFALKPTISCALNTVNVSTTTPFRIGRPQGYYVSYCNNGTVLSPNTYITIKLDSLLDINSATTPFTTLPNHTYRFNIGNLDYLSCGNFSFVATPNRNSAILGQTLCVEAHIYPDTICTSPNYTGAIIVASAQCTGDSVELKLENRGGNMQQIKHYIVIEDQVMRINHTYQLPRNGTLTEKLPSDSGHTYRITAEQEDNLPAIYGDKSATAAIEGCRPNPADNFSIGYFTQFPNYDGEPFRAVSCNTITGSYDPNTKAASPLGYDTPHYIEKNTQIDYQINFQNTGNDTAFKVIVVDTIAPTLGINSIQLEVASHPYQFQRIDSNVVRFVFDGIMLVDSFRNEPKSHGFIKFKIQQKLNNPSGTKIYNSAAIYFDYNAPIITNQTFHTVGQDFLRVNLISGVRNPTYLVKEVKVFPNPFRDKTQIVIESNELKNPVLQLMDINGQLIKVIPSVNNNNFTIYREDLTNGMYFFKIMQGNEEVTNGKIIVQ